MSSQKLEQEVIPQATQIAAVTKESVEDSLVLLLQRLPDYFRGRAEREDIETLVFCLHCLYNCIDTLYQHTLPTLTQLTAQRNAATFAHRHALWEQLQALLLLLERIESHCHLLLSTTTCVLATLDTTEDAAFSPEAPTTYVGTEQWQHAYEILSLALHNWQEQHKMHLTFASAFAHTSHASLVQIDTALALLFDSANAIFGDIIPDIQLVAQGDDEVVAMLLFDLMQQNDLFLIQISKLVEPLQQLMKLYAVKE
jgi:hypothetical protein